MPGEMNVSDPGREVRKAEVDRERGIGPGKSLCSAEFQCVSLG